MNTIKSRLKGSTVALMAGGALMVGMGAMSVANAAVSDLFNPLGTIWGDTSAEYWIDTNASSTLDAGDRLRGIFRVENLQGTFDPHDTSGLELSGIFDTTVTAAIDNMNGTFDYSFGPTIGGSFETAYGVGALVAFFTDPSEDVQVAGGTCTSVADGGDCESNVTDGTHLVTFGHVGNAQEGWIAEDSNPFPSAGTDLSPTTRLGTFFINFSLVENNTNQTFIQSECFDLTFNVAHGRTGPAVCDAVASGEVLGSKGTTSPYDVTDNLDFEFESVAIPEPGMLGLFGLGLLGLGAVARRRGKKA